MTTTPDQQIARLQYTIREQMALMEQMQAEIDRLVAWIQGDKDALTCLQLSTTTLTNPQAIRSEPQQLQLAMKDPR